VGAGGGVGRGAWRWGIAAAPSSGLTPTVATASYIEVRIGGFRVVVPARRTGV
jgi:hypothetical protein